MLKPVKTQRGDFTPARTPWAVLSIKAGLLCLQSQKTHWNLKLNLSVTFEQNKYFRCHLRCYVPLNTGLNASQEMLIPVTAIWRHTARSPHSVTPNPTIPIALLSLPVSRWECHTPAASCIHVCMFVYAHREACCASTITASISDKPNESPENSYLPAFSCSVLSSLFSLPVFLLLVFSPLSCFLPS